MKKSTKKYFLKNSCSKMKHFWLQHTQKNSVRNPVRTSVCRDVRHPVTQNISNVFYRFHSLTQFSIPKTVILSSMDIMPWIFHSIPLFNITASHCLCVSVHEGTVPPLIWILAHSAAFPLSPSFLSIPTNQSFNKPNVLPVSLCWKSLCH